MASSPNLEFIVNYNQSTRDEKTRTEVLIRAGFDVRPIRIYAAFTSS